MRGDRGQRLLRRRGEYVERTFAHVYDTGGMRRTHLRGHPNILKRLLIHVCGFNLGLVMRHLIGIGTPRGLQDRVAGVIAALVVLVADARARMAAICASDRVWAARRSLGSLTNLGVNSAANATCTTGC
jgi:transposase